MSSVMQDVGRILPVRHITDLLQDAWLGYGWNVVASLVVLAYLVTALALTWILFYRRIA